MLKQLTRLHRTTLTLTVALLVLFAVSQGLRMRQAFIVALRDPPPTPA